MISKKLREQMEVIIDGCLECKSKPCMKTCIMLNEFGENPKEILKNCIEKNEIPDKMVYSCNMCNRCTVVCPKNFRIQDIFMESRVMKIKENNGKSPIKGHKAIEAHQYLGYSTIFNTVNKAPNGKKTKRIFRINKYLYFYRFHNNNMTKLSSWKKKAWIQLYKKHKKKTIQNLENTIKLK